MLYLPSAALLACLASVASAVDLSHVKLDFDVLKGDSRLSAEKGARASLVSTGGTTLDLINQYSYYSSTIKVGSNGDENIVLVDTGSSDLWVMASNVACYAQPNTKRSLNAYSPSAHHQVFGFQNSQAPPTRDFKKRDIQNSTSTATTATTATQTLTRIDAATCTSLGSFNTDDSTSFHVNSSAPPFSIYYGGGTFANGFWGTDSVSVGPFDVDVSIAVVNDTTNQFGVFGIGLSGLEVTYDSDLTNYYKYENFPIRLKSTGLIEKVAYSLYLNDVNALSGSVLFGAVDHAKYTGQLQTVPIVNVYPQYFSKPISFNVALDSITVGDSTQNITVTTDSLPALLDSGTTLTYLPQPIADSLAASLNAKVSPFGFYEVDCQYNTSTAFATYNFSGIEINVPLSDLIMTPIVSQTNDTKCYLGVLGSANLAAGAPTCILGDNFLRHAYIVYDLEEYEISLAQVKYTDSENIEAISGVVPSAVKAPGYSNTAIASVIGAQPSHGYLTLPSTSSQFSSSYTTSAYFGGSSDSVAASPAVTTAVSSGSSAVSSATSITGASNVAFSVSSSVVASSVVSWNASYVSTSSSTAVTGTGIAGSLTTATNVGVYTSTDAAGSTVLVTYTYTTTYCPESSLASALNSLTTATNVVVSTSTNAAGSTVLITNTYTTTYCPASAASAASAASVSSAASVASAASSLTTATGVVVFTSTNAAGSTVLITNTYTTTYCPASAASTASAASAAPAASVSSVTIVASVSSGATATATSSSVDATTYVTIVRTIGKSTTTQVSAIPASSAPAALSSSSYVIGNSTIASSTPSAQTSSVTILQGGSSTLSFISGMLLVPLFALI